MLYIKIFTLVVGIIFCIPLIKPIMQLFILISILILGYIGFVIWTFIKRKYRIGCFLIGIPILLYGFLFLISNWTLIGIKKDIYSKKYKTEKVIFSFDTNRDFHGDGFSIKVDSLKKQDIRYFSEIDLNYLENYPKRNYHLNDYRIGKWKKTPVDSSDSLQYQFALVPYDKWIFINPIDSEKIQPYIDLTKKLLDESGNYYAYLFRDHPYGFYGLDLFLISPKNGLIIAINKQ